MCPIKLLFPFLFDSLSNIEDLIFAHDTFGPKLFAVKLIILLSVNDRLDFVTDSSGKVAVCHIDTFRFRYKVPEVLAAFLVVGLEERHLVGAYEGALHDGLCSENQVPGLGRAGA